MFKDQQTQIKRIFNVLVSFYNIVLGVVFSQHCIMDQEVENIASVNEYRVETVNFTRDLKTDHFFFKCPLNFTYILTYC